MLRGTPPLCATLVLSLFRAVLSHQPPIPPAELTTMMMRKAVLLSLAILLLAAAQAVDGRALRQQSQWWSFPAGGTTQQQLPQWAGAQQQQQWPSSQQSVTVINTAATTTSSQLPQATTTFLPANFQPASQQASFSQASTSTTSNLQQQQQQQQQQQPSSATSAGQSNPTAAAAGDAVNDAVLQQVLDMHNRFRARHQAAPLAWSSGLQASAQRWADGCVFQHSQTGENLGLNFPDFPSVVQAWYDEISQYDYQAGQFGQATGHATQVLWRGSTQLGCGYATDCSLWVCHYDPPGNVIGQFQSNVFPATS